METKIFSHDRLVELSKELSYLRETCDILRKALEEYGPDSIAISFNGGKDCTLLLYLFYVMEINYRKQRKLPTRHIRALYVKGLNPFRQVEEFIEKCKIDLSLNLETYLGNQKQVLKVFLDTNPTTKAIIIGTRRTDPYSQNLQPLQETDGDWPKVMRIHPMLDWSFENVWNVIFKLKIPYCVLYDEGYTSLGDVSNTRPNPKLLLPDGSYSPAYKLKDGKDERDGRIAKK